MSETHPHQITTTQTPAEQLDKLSADFERVREAYNTAVLSLCTELPVCQVFDARLSLVEGISSFDPDIDFEEEGRITYEGVDIGYFDVELQGTDYPRYNREFSGEYQDHDVFVGRITVQLTEEATKLV